MLKQSLVSNALFSGLSGLLILTFKEWVSAQFPGPTWLWLIVGMGLLIFAAQLIAMVLIPKLAKMLTPQVVIADIGWVVLTFVGLAIFFTSITETGVLLVIGINAVVGTLALMQHLGYRREFTATA